MASRPSECGQLLAALQAARAEISGVDKTGHNAFHKYDFVQAEELFRIVRPLLQSHGIWVFQDIEGQPFVDGCGVSHVVFSFRVFHTSGEQLPFPIRVFASGSDRDSKGQWGDKGAYKANTGAWKYFFLRLFTFDSGEHEPEDATDLPVIRRDSGQESPTPAERATLPDYGRDPKEAQVNRQASLLPPRGTPPESRPASEADIKRVAFWPKAFRAAEKFFPEDEQRKFYAADWACAQLNLKGVRSATVSQLRQLVELLDNYRGELPDEKEEPPIGEPPAESAYDDLF